MKLDKDKRSYRVDPMRALLIIQGHSDGKTLEEIGSQLGVSRERVRQLADRLGLKFTGRNIPDAEKVKRTALGLLECGASMSEAANAVGVSAVTLWDWGLRSRWCELNRQQHGIQAYRRGCRCEVCRSANSTQMRAIKGREPREHGTVSAYINYGCRCEPCRKAGSENNWRVAERRKQREAQAC